MSKYKISLKQDSNVTAYSYSKKGDLGNFYSPLQNLNKDSGMGDFTTDKLGYDYQTPVEIELVDEYDGSENIIINNDKKFPTLINSRFSVQENNTYLIPEHTGNSVTNIYNEDSLNIESSLLKLYDKIPTLTFDGITDGGSFKCGSYVFYFKYADSDNNLSNVVQESGIVQIHVGQPGTVKVRMGLEDEQANKNVHFTLTNVDKGFDYVRVFYERTSSGQSQASAASYFMIDQNFPILNQICDIFLTGDEAQVQITKSDLETEFADIQSAKTSAVNSNILFLGNTTAYEQKYQDLQQIAWMIQPKAILEDNPIGSLSETYDFDGTSGCYYDVKNVYNYTGYWPDEYYRFGVVFIYNNNQCSNVYNIQGADLSKALVYSDFLNSEGNSYESEPENYIFNESKMTNSKGVVKFPRENVLNYSNENFTPRVLGIQFNLSHIKDQYNKLKRGTASKPDLESILKSYNIKGLFFVRQKRIPSIYAQGIVVGLTGKDNGCLPVLKDTQSSTYITKSFLNKDRLLLNNGSTVNITSKVLNKAVFVPDSELQEATYNQIFTGQEFSLSKIGSTTQNSDSDHYYITGINPSNDYSEKVSKVTAVQKDVKLLTDGETYFSTLAGSPHEPTKTADVNNVWNKTAPQNLTTSTSLVRGKWGYYVGISNDAFNYGDIINIKSKGFAQNENEQNLLEFQKRFNDSSMYSAVSERVNVDDLSDLTTCFRGDCFPSLFTHKVMNNFIDPELPTNTKIIDPACWCNNYAVRCTAVLEKTAHSNMTADNAGWVIPQTSKQQRKEKAVNITMAILTLGLGALHSSISDDSITEQSEFANEIVQAFETKSLSLKSETQIIFSGEKDDESITLEDNNSVADLEKLGYIRKVDPVEQENNSGINLKAIFKPSTGWNLHGIASINRADVNAVSFAQWLTFPICSSMNLAFRDNDFSQPTEEASMNKKRSFYPLEAMDPTNHLVESNALNHGTKKSIASIQKVAYQNVPFLKQEFFNRIYWSRPNAAQSFVNSYRMIFSSQFREYPKEYGSITKLVSIGNGLVIVFQHGIMTLPVNTTPQSENESSPYLAFKSVLPTNGTVLSDTFGSMWKDSVIKSDKTNMIYGVDTVAKNIWRINGQGLEILSDHVLNKFLNEHLSLSEFDYQEYLGHINVKTHYNAFKNDIMFTFYKDIPTKYELTEEQEKTITDNFLEDKIGYSGPTINSISNNVIDITSVSVNGFDTTIEVKYKCATEIAGGVFRLNYSINNKKYSIPLYYHPDWDTDNALFNILLEGKATVIFIPNIGYRIFEDLDKGPIYNSNILTLENGLSPLTGGTVSMISESKNPSVFYVKTWEERIQKYNIRKGYVYSEENKPITPIRPVEWKKGLTWSLCYNENTKCFQTFYDWTPLQSANIDNIYFSFDKEATDEIINQNQNSQIKTIKPSLRQSFLNNSIPYVSSVEPKEYQINKSVVDRAFSNRVPEYYYKVIMSQNNGNAAIDWEYDIKENEVLCFYTNTNVEFWYNGSKNQSNVKHIILCYQKPTIADQSNIADYIEDSSIGQNYLFHILYKVDKAVSQMTIRVRSYDSLTITDPHIIRNVTPDQIKKGNFNYYEYRDTNVNTMKLWKHGQAGLYDNQGKIKPTNWYGKQHEFNFEFIVNSTPEMQKIFNNLMIISNKTAPKKFEYEVVGEGYDWYIYKTVIGWINQHKDDLFQSSLDDAYKCVLTTPYKTLRDNYEDFPELFNFDDAAIITKLPYLQLQLTDQDGLFYNSDKDLSYWANKQPNNTTKENNYSLNSSETCLIEDDQLSEYKLHTESLANDMKKYGRARGNMEYLEDVWKVEIRPVNFRYAYINNGQLNFSKIYETRHRDKFLRIKIRYDGKDLAVIQQIATLFDLSYA